MTCEKITSQQAVLPILILSFCLAAFFIFQTCLIFSDRSSLNAVYEQQNAPLEQVEKVKTRVNGMIKGLLTLSKQGNKNATAIIDDLKKAGITFQDEPAPGATPPAAPAKP
jgi:hypothetical protein